ncbi:tubby-related protein 4-like [Mytilus californianus]|uniref:tubby-related protein 4-like n=1 Tax=Mytilus californianus TaxID=6549 RepID=UPI002246CCF8|nr:tubby-related protein 4-like [Mytilus californianus]
MHVHFEQNNTTRSECTIHSLSWMGKVPDTLPEDEGGWKLNRNQYYMEGWLAGGNGKGVVGVTFTTSHCRKYDPPQRSNFNLRGHRSEVILVKWNEPYQKLASCDSQGVIFVWIKHEGRWSIELINDRNNQVTDFAWSHDGRMALICYCDGFVLVGSVAGQRYWSYMLNLDNSNVTCGIWTPDDQKVIFGTTDGQVILMSSAGVMLTQISVQIGMDIVSMAWSSEKFNMDETDGNTQTSRQSLSSKEETHILAVCFRYGAVYLMSSPDDPSPHIVHTLLTGLKMEWSNCGKVLALGGFTRLPNLQCQNEVHFYSSEGTLLHQTSLPSQGKPLTAMCWGHNDRRLFMASGHNLFVAWVIKHVAPLQFMCQRTIQNCVRNEKNTHLIPLPTRLRHSVQELFSPTIKSYIPDPFKLREFISTPPPSIERLYCTMVRHGEESSGGHYILYLEYLGGLIPLLKGKRASKLRPDFVVYDPKIKPTWVGDGTTHYEYDVESSTDSDDDLSSEGCGSPRMQRRKRPKQFRAEKVERSITFRTLHDLLFDDNLPESSRLVEVTSNIWGTKFQINGVAPFLPEDLGNIVYKTSLLHLQPRQMAITVTGLQSSHQQLSRDSNFTPAGSGADDDYISLNIGGIESMEEESLTIIETENGLNTQFTLNVTREDNLYIDTSSDNPVSNGINGSGCRGTNMKNRVLSPASDTFAHNKAFSCESQEILKDKISNQGAIPKVRAIAGSSSSSNGCDVTPGIKCSMSENVNAVAQNLVFTDVKSETSSPESPSSNTSNNLYEDVQNLLRCDEVNRWADLANCPIKYIDDDNISIRRVNSQESMLICDSSQLLRSNSGKERRLYFSSASTATTKLDNGLSLEHRDSIYSVDSDNETCFDIADDMNIDVKSENVLSNHEFYPSGRKLRESTSLPSSPLKRLDNQESPTYKIREEAMKSKCKHHSPIFKRKSKYLRQHELSSEELSSCLKENNQNFSYKNLESFQKSQLKQKMKKVRRSSQEGLPQFVMHNKAPMWNENSQVYQLDFGGRVTQESAKNFQIEFRGKQVMQFGRIDSNAYTLDFQYPFTALQAFAVALANVTQRLK